MKIEEIARTEVVRSVVEDHRSMCFWNVAENFFLRDHAQLLMALVCLGKYGDVAACRRAGRIRQWL